MAYLTQSLLTSDADFVGRARACCTEQAENYRTIGPDFVALAESVLRGEAEGVFAFVRIVASAPGIADKAATGTDHIIDSSKVTDEDILSTVQANRASRPPLPSVSLAHEHRRPGRAAKRRGGGY